MSLTFQKLRDANRTRQKEWPGNEKADLAFRALEVAGECGEAMEKVKKYLRAERGIAGSTATADEVAEEIADAIIGLDLLAAELRLDMSKAVVDKFNMTSDKYGMQTKLGMTKDNQKLEQYRTTLKFAVEVLNEILNPRHPGAAQRARTVIYNATKLLDGC